MNEWLFVNLPVKTDAVFVSAVWVRYDGKEPNKQRERSVSQHFPSPLLLSLPKTMPQLLLKSNTVVYFHAIYHAYFWKATFKQEKQNKTVCRGREEQEHFGAGKLQQSDKSKTGRKQNIFRNMVILESRPPCGSWNPMHCFPCIKM